MFHEQLWSVFDAQSWFDKELVVVETYTIRPSHFLGLKAQDDSRLVYVPLQVSSKQGDLSIGLKRNMCTYLATGEVLANFDDDDIYAPSYLSSMVEALHKEHVAAVTLSSWYVFDVACGKFGFVDPVQAKEMQAANAPKDIDHWLYGYGFSYVYTLDAAIENPYPNRNLGEDFDFMKALRLQRLLENGPVRGGVALVYDSYGLCLHTLHARSTSNNWAQREVTREELEDLDVADLSEVLLRYLQRFPAKESSSKFIANRIERRLRPLAVRSPLGELSVRCPAGARAQDVLELMAKQLGCCVRDAELFRTAGEGDGPCGPPLEATERVGLRTQRLFAQLPKGIEGLDISLTVTDMQDHTMSVSVALPHPFVQMQAVREALVEQHGPGGDAAKRLARGVRLAECRKSKASFVAVEPTSWLGDSREFYSAGLAELLRRPRHPSCD